MNFISELLRSPWYIQPEWVLNALPVLKSLLEGNGIPDQKQHDFYAKSHEAYCVNAQGETTPIPSLERRGVAGAQSNAQSDDGLVAVVPILGEITKYDKQSGGPGTKSIEATLKQFAGNPKVKSIVLQIDSPGGAVYGTLMLTQTVKEISQRMPVVAFVDSMACSAGMEIASAANEIYASHAKDLVGSIGTMISFANVKPALEKEGVEFHEIYATRSTEKNKDFSEALKKNYKPLIANLLDPLNEDFIQTIRNNRKGKLDEKKEAEVFSGRTLFAESAMSFGLIDGVASFESVVNRARELAKSKYEPVKFSR